jgi:hypothetical protein
MKDAWRKLKMLWTLARRGAWYGVGRFSGAWTWGLTHHHCRQCGGPRKFGASPNCVKCQYVNLLRALDKIEDEEE